MCMLPFMPASYSSGKTSTPTLAWHRSGITLTDKRSPVIRLLWIALLEFKLRIAQGIGARLALIDEVLVKFDHQFLRCCIGYFPQAHHQCSGPDQHKGTAQPEDAFPSLYFAKSGLTGGEDH